MTVLIRSLAILLVLAAVSCVTINIYFPAEEVRHAADQIVNEVWGQHPAKPDAAPTPAPAAPPPADRKGSSLRHLFGPAVAYAAQDINVSTPEIRTIKGAMKDRSAQLFPYLDKGNVGIGSDGLLKVRSADGLDLKGRGEVARLVKEENADRQRLYKEIARANGFPDKTDEVQSVFADSWRANAATGWYLEKADGSWSRK